MSYSLATIYRTPLYLAADNAILNYGESTYSSETYSGQLSGGSSSGGLFGGGLSQTGTSIIFVVTVSAVILFCSLLWIILRRPSK